MSAPLIYLLSLSTVSALTCTSCPFRLEPPFSLSCDDSCQGDVCYIVVNKYFNGTVIAGCISAGEEDLVHNGTSVCHRENEHTMCACTSSDKCNDPRAPLAKFEFSEHKILEGYQVFPQIQPTEPSVIPMEASEDAEENTIQKQNLENITTTEERKTTTVDLRWRNDTMTTKNSSSSRSEAKNTTETPFWNTTVATVKANKGFSMVSNHTRMLNDSSTAPPTKLSSPIRCSALLVFTVLPLLLK